MTQFSAFSVNVDKSHWNHVNESLPTLGSTVLAMDELGNVTTCVYSSEFSGFATIAFTKRNVSLSANDGVILWRYASEAGIRIG